MGQQAELYRTSGTQSLWIGDQLHDGDATIPSQRQHAQAHAEILAMLKQADRSLKLIANTGINALHCQLEKSWQRK
ncbi:MAG: hypothetical protein WA071_26825 [Undibacterium umbellatum]|uniref:hypothetical protein n=1 Tax=Undibacterium umbellatum TaxID=2762300 RepID=UPI003BB70F97